MIRNDFVSNSSTSSFIITNPTDVIISKADLVHKLLCKVDSYIQFNFKDQQNLNQARSVFDASKVEYDYCNDPKDLYLNISCGQYLKSLTQNQLISVLKLCTCVYVELGDDYDYDSMCKAIQIATLLELESGLKIEPDCHFHYNSIHELLKD